MKTQILQLEPHDDVISTRDKIGWGQAGRILLVWPNRAGILTRRLDLQLLLRHSNKLSAQLALVTRHPEVRFQAFLLGIPVFRSVRQAQTSRWRRPRRLRREVPWQKDGRRAESGEPRSLRAELEALRHEARPSPLNWLIHPGTRLGLFTLGVLAFLAIAGVLYPSAQIRLTPQTQTQSATLNAQASQALQAISLSGTIPARRMSVSVEGRDSLRVTGSTRIPERAATGLARFTNLTGQEVVIPQGTVVRALNPQTVRFATIRAGIVPPSPEGSIQISIRALTAGEAGNLPADSVRSVEGELGLQLAVTNPAPTRGGSDFISPAPSKLDRNRLYNRLLIALRETAAAEIASQLDEGDMPLTTTPTLSAVLEESYEPADDSPADELQLTLRLEFQALIAPAEDLRAYAGSLLDANLPPGYTSREGSLVMEQVSPPTMRQIDSDEFLQWRMIARRKIQAETPFAEAINLTIGLPLEKASQKLTQGFSLAAPPQITITPTWWPWLPLLPFRIQVLVEP